MRLWLVIFILVSVVCTAPVYAEVLDGKTATTKRMPHKVDRTSEAYFKSAQTRAEKGSKDSQLYLAEMLDGKRPSFYTDPVLATAWYRRAAEGGLGKAQFALAERYETGHTVEQDLQKAFDWYVRAAETGNVLAARKVAAFYLEGRIGAADKAKAYYWYERAEKGSAEAAALKEQMKAAEISRADRMIFMNDLWQSTSSYWVGKYKSIKRSIKRFAYLSRSLIGFSIWLAIVFFVLKYRPAGITWMNFLTGPVAAAAGSGLAIGFLLLVLSIRGAMFFLFFFVLMLGMANLLPLFYAGACFLLGLSCFRPSVQTQARLQHAGILVGVFATFLFLGTFSPFLFLGK